MQARVCIPYPGLPFTHHICHSDSLVYFLLVSYMWADLYHYLNECVNVGYTVFLYFCGYKSMCNSNDGNTEKTWGRVKTKFK